MAESPWTRGRRRLDLDPSSVPPKTQRYVITLAYGYAFAGLLVGVLITALGVYLIVKGVTGSITWVTQVSGFSSRLANATPGVLLCVGGIIIIFVTRARITIRKAAGSGSQKARKPTRSTRAE